MHLEGGEYMTGRDIQLAGLRSVVTDARQLFLKPADARQFGAELRLLAGHRLFIGPYAQAFGSQTFPREQWAGVEFAQGAMSLWPMIWRGLMPWRWLMSLSRTISDWICASLYGNQRRPVGVSLKPGLTISMPIELELSQVRPCH